jgi:DNA-directed RNA polymerase subunit RPC12/RpoP
MKKLIPKDYDETEFNVAIQGKSRINVDITNITARFADFENNKPKLENLPKSYNKPSNCKDLEDLACDLYSLYDSKSAASIKFKEEIQKISEIKCPYCGIDTPSHLDHFLPRSKFPEFSIFAPNLIYVCSICNSKYKGDDVVNANGDRKYFNPYFDDFIDSLQFLKCKIEVNGSMYPKFKFYIEDLSATKPYEYTVMSNHFENMKLGKRYMEQIAKEKFLRFKNRYVDKNTRLFKDISLDKLKEDIEYELGGLIDLNDNNWEKVFWESLKHCDECLLLIVDKKIT